MSYHTTRDASFDLEYSFVAVTIGCCPVIKDALKDRLLELTKEVFQGQYGCRILDINVGADFVHVHFDAKPSTALGELARYYIRHTGACLWSEFGAYLKPYLSGSTLRWERDYFLCIENSRCHDMAESFIYEKRKKASATGSTAELPNLPAKARGEKVLSRFGALIYELRRENDENADVHSKTTLFGVHPSVFREKVLQCDAPKEEWIEALCKEYGMTRDEFDERMAHIDARAFDLRKPSPEKEEDDQSEFYNYNNGVQRVCEMYGIGVGDIANETNFPKIYVQKLYDDPSAEALQKFESAIKAVYPAAFQKTNAKSVRR